MVALDMSAQAKAEETVRNHLFMLQRAADAAQAITWHQALEGTMQEVVLQVRGVIGTHQAAVMLCKRKTIVMPYFVGIGMRIVRRIISCIRWSIL